MRKRRYVLMGWALAGLFAVGCSDSGDNVDPPGPPDAASDTSPDRRDAGDEKDAGETGDEGGEGGDAGEAGDDVSVDAEGGPADAEAGSDALPPGVCGDGVLNAGEACDDGFRDACGSCNADCTGAGDGRAHVACGCAPSDAGVGVDAGPDGGLKGVGEDFTRDMVGCPGHVSWQDRGMLCAPGYTPCSADQWVQRRDGRAPLHHYWTDDDLKYVYESRDGIHDSCYYSKTYGGACATPTHVCADRDVDPEGNYCSETPNKYPRNCGRLDPPPIANEYFGGYYGDFTAGTLCCCDAVPDSGHGCGPGSGLGDVFSNGMYGCNAKKSWQDRASICATGCSVCTAQQWMDRRQGQAPHHNYWTNDNLKVSGWGDGQCNVSKLYGTDGAPYPMRVCASHMDSEGNSCVWIDCGYADIPPPPNEYLGGCSDIWAGTVCCKP
jgi:hypothetical protein